MLYNNITLLPSVNTLIARGMFCGAKYTHLYTSKHPGKKSFIDKNMRKSHWLKLCTSQKINWPLHEDPLLKVTALIKAIIRIICKKN